MNMKKILLILLLSCVSQVYGQANLINNGGGVDCDSLNTLYAYTYLNHGAMFNVVAKADDVMLDHLTANIKNGTIEYYIYYKMGSFLGFEQQASAWTLIDSMSVTSNNTLTISNEATVIPIDLNLTINTGDTVAFYLVSPVLSKVYLTTTSTPWPDEYVADTNISISVARSVYQSFGTPFSTPQIWNGSVSYCVQSPVGIDDINDPANELSVFQSDKQLNIQITQECLDQNSGLSISLIDIMSRKVESFEINSTNTRISTEGLSGGVYLCVLNGQTKLLDRKKVFVR